MLSRSPLQSIWASRDAPLRGAVLAREAGHHLVWDSTWQLTLLDREGRVLAERRSARPLAAVAGAEDGRSYAAASSEGQVWLLDEALRTRWEVQVPARPLALAVTPFGSHLAVTDEGGGLSLFSGRGQRLWHATAPCRLHLLVFLAEKPLLVGCAEQGVLVAYSLNGQALWRDAPGTYVGSLAATGDGSLLAVACYSDGALFYSSAGQRLATPALKEPCRRLLLSYDGRVLLHEHLERRLELRAREGEVLRVCPLDASPAAVTLDALGRHAYLALPGGTLARFSRDAAG